MLLNPDKYFNVLGNLTSTNSLSLKAFSSILVTPSGISTYFNLLKPKVVGITVSPLESFSSDISLRVNAPPSNSVTLSGITKDCSLLPLNADPLIVVTLSGISIDVKALYRNASFPMTLIVLGNFTEFIPTFGSALLLKSSIKNAPSPISVIASPFSLTKGNIKFLLLLNFSFPILEKPVIDVPE